MSLTPIVFILIILLFGFDSARRSESREKTSNSLKCRSSKA